MTFTRTKLLVVGVWIYFVTAVVLYGRFGIAWINTVDLLLGFAVLLVLSVWYVIQTTRSRDASRPQSRWVIGRYGDIHRRAEPPSDSANLPT